MSQSSSVHLRMTTLLRCGSLRKVPPNLEFSRNDVVMLSLLTRSGSMVEKMIQSTRALETSSHALLMDNWETSVCLTSSKAWTTVRKTYRKASWAEKKVIMAWAKLSNLTFASSERETGQTLLPATRGQKLFVIELHICGSQLTTQYRESQLKTLQLESE